LLISVIVNKMSIPLAIVVKSDALTTNDTGPMADTCINAGGNALKSWHRPSETCTVRMITEKVHQPVVHWVWNIQECHLTEKRWLANCVEGLTKVESNDHDIWVGGQKVRNRLQECSEGCGGRPCRAESILVSYWS